MRSAKREEMAPSPGPLANPSQFGNSLGGEAFQFSSRICYPELRSRGARPPRALLAAPSRRAFDVLHWNQRQEHLCAPVFSVGGAESSARGGRIPLLTS